MKELSIEEKAKAYDEATKKAESLYKAAESMSGCNVIIEILFPELKESEDERIRKVIIEHFAGSHSFMYPYKGFTKKQILDWLEKQGEQDNNEDSNILQRFSFYSYKDEPNVLYLSGLYVNEECRNKGNGIKILEVADEVAKNLNCHTIRLKTKKDSNAERLYRTHGYNSLATEESDEIWLEKQAQKPADKIEPKFKQGDWVVNERHSYLIAYIDYEQRRYLFEIGGYTHEQLNWEYIENADKKYHLWTIQDAKDGDVLMANAPFIFNGNLEGGIGCPGAHCGINTLGKFQIPEDKKHWTGHTTTPATKEQRDILEKAITEAGYTFDFEKKELKRIEKKPAAWSEEDEEQFSFCCAAIELSNYSSDEYRNYAISFLESLRDRVQLKQEWSEEDEEQVRQIERIVHNEGYSKKLQEQITNWLKSLRPNR